MTLGTASPRVSVIINNYNYADFVGVAVQSVLCQTHAVHETIVVDDGSTDGSMVVINGFRPHVTVIEKANGGQGSAYNAGFIACSGQVIIFLDADDWLFPEAVAQILARWTDAVSKIQYPLTMVDRHGRSLERQVPRSMSDVDALELLQQFGTYGSPPGSGNAYAADFLRNILPLNEKQWRIAADTVPISLAPLYGELRSINGPLGAYRLHRSDSTSLLMNNAPAELWNEYDRIHTTKRFVEAELATLGRTRRLPLQLAPWEARIAMLCVRFGGAAPERLGRSAFSIACFALRSLWNWPQWGVKQKLIQSAWMLALTVLPRGLARRAALKHKTTVGLPAPLANVSGAS